MNYLFSTLFLVTLFFSCKVNTPSDSVPEKYKSLFSNVQLLVESNPEIAINITDSLLAINGVEHLSNASKVKVYQFRELAFRKLNKFNEAVTSNGKILEIAALMHDSVLVAESIVSLFDGAEYEQIKPAEKYFPFAIKYFSKLDKGLELGKCAFLYGTLLNNQGDFKNAQRYLLQSFEIFDQLNTLNSKSKSAISIGSNYADIGSMKLSNEYYLIGLEIARSLNDSLLQSNAIVDLGLNLKKSMQLDSALANYKLAFTLLPAGRYEKKRIRIEYNIANIYFHKRDYNKAEQVFKKILTYSLLSKNFEAASMSYNALAAVANAKKDNAGMLKYYDKAIYLMDSLGQTQHLLLLYPNIVNARENINDYKGALEASKKMKTLSDSLLTLEKQVAVHELDKKYQTEKKDLENSYLRKDALIKKYSIGILILILLVLAILFKQRTKLLKERSFAYGVLMEKYKQEKVSRISGDQNLNELAINGLKQQLVEIQMAPTVFEKLVSFYELEKPYLNPRLKVDDIFKLFSISQKELAVILKANGNTNFSAFTNKYRVEEARLLFEEPKYANIKMEVIAEQSGFGTIQSFYNAFELYTGVKPAYYRSSILANTNHD